VVGVEGQLKQLVGFVELLFGNELSSLVEGLQKCSLGVSFPLWMLVSIFTSAIPVVYL
jgi:hypothetical protein